MVDYKALRGIAKNFFGTIKVLYLLIGVALRVKSRQKVGRHLSKVRLCPEDLNRCGRRIQSLPLSLTTEASRQHRTLGNAEIALGQGYLYSNAPDSKANI
jgi:hypothetical protein